MFMETAFGGAPLGRRILGTPKTVRAQTPFSMRDFLDRQYRAPEMVVAAAGAVDHDAVVDEVVETLRPVWPPTRQRRP